MAHLRSVDEKVVINEEEKEKSMSILTFLTAPFKVLDCLKKKHPRIVFSILMAFETFNFVGDCFQLQLVISINRLYNADPYQLSGVFNKIMPWTLQWDLIETDPPTLGYSLPWDGMASGVTANINFPYVLNMNCDMNWRYSDQLFRGGSWYTSLTHESSGSHYLNINRTNHVHIRKGVCVRIQDVFDEDFLSYGKIHKSAVSVSNNGGDDDYHPNTIATINAEGPKHYLCPNNKTAIFDANSYIIDVTPLTIEQQILQHQRTQTIRPYNATLHYKKGWIKSVFQSYQCRVLSSIYVGTAAIFAVECLLIICQLCVGILCLVRGHDTDTPLFVTKIVEMPLIGFLLAPCLLTRNDWQMYANLDLAKDEAAFKESDVVARITGFKNPNNFWFKYKIKASKTNIFYPLFILSFINDHVDDDYVNGKIPPTQSIAQALFYSMVLPWTSTFWKVFLSQSPLVAVCVGLVLLVVWCAYLPFYFLAFCIPMVVSAFLYGDKLFLSRLFHDIPNLIMTITYIVLIQFTPITGLSAAQSALLIFYYMSRLMVRAIQDVLTKQPDTVHYMSHAFGELTVQKALYFAFIQPMMTLLLSPIWSTWLAIPIWILRKLDGWNGIQIEHWILWNVDDELREEGQEVFVEEAVATALGQQGKDGQQQKPNAFDATVQKAGISRNTVVPDA